MQIRVQEHLSTYIFSGLKYYYKDKLLSAAPRVYFGYRIKSSRIKEAHVFPQESKHFHTNFFSFQFYNFLTKKYFQPVTTASATWSKCQANQRYIMPINK